MRFPYVLFAIAILTSGCLGSTAKNPGSNDGPPLSVTEAAEQAFPNLVGNGIVVVAGPPDYTSVALSLLDTAGNVVAESFLDSGSQTPQLSTALSGDVVPAGNPTPASEVVVIDRTNSVLTWIDPDSRTVLRQRVVGEPFYGHNPHDYLELSNSKGYVTRWDPVYNEDGELESGSDILVFDPSTGEELGTIDLSGEVVAVPNTTANTLARPDRLLAVEDYVYVVLQNITDDGSFVAANSVVAVIDPENDRVVGSLVLDGLENCGSAVYSKPVSEVYLVCSGNFAKGPVLQVGRSGIAVLDVSTPAAPTFARAISAQAFAERPLADVLGLVTATHVAVVEYGELDFVTFEVVANENIYVVDTTATTNIASRIYSVAGAYQLTVFADPVHARLYIGDADFTDPRLAVYAVTRETGGVAPLAEHRFSNGFAVRSMGLY